MFVFCALILIFNAFAEKFAYSITLEEIRSNHLCKKVLLTSVAVGAFAGTALTVYYCFNDRDSANSDSEIAEAEALQDVITSGSWECRQSDYPPHCSFTLASQIFSNSTTGDLLQFPCPASHCLDAISDLVGGVYQNYQSLIQQAVQAKARMMVLTTTTLGAAAGTTAYFVYECVKKCFKKPSRTSIREPLNNYYPPAEEDYAISDSGDEPSI